jgi:hypothetical protein
MSIAIVAKRPMMRPISEDVPPRLATYRGMTGRMK